MQNEIISANDFLGLDADFYWKKYKKHINNITSQDLPEFLVQFYWAPLLHHPDKQTKSKLKKLNSKRRNAHSNLRKKENTKKNNFLFNNYLNEGGGLEELKRISMLPSEQLPDIILLGK